MKKLLKCLLILSMILTSIFSISFQMMSLKATESYKEYLVSEDAFIRSDRSTSSYNYENITQAHGSQYVGKDLKVINSKYSGNNIFGLMKLPLPTESEIEENGLDTYKFIFNIFKNPNYNTGDQVYHFYYTTDTNWSETSVTWNNKPESVKRNAENLLFDFEIKQGFEYEFKSDEEKRITVDITDKVEQLVADGIKAITVFVVSENSMNTSLMIHSKESGNDGISRAAKLVASKVGYTQEKLAGLIKECQDLNSDEYTKDSFADLQSVLDTAIAVNQNENATTAEIRTVYNELLTAKESLVSSADSNDAQNIAYGKPARSNLDKNNVYKVTDGDLSTSWQGKFFPSYVDIDLMDTYDIKDINLFFPAGKAFYYTVYGSNDGSYYTEIYQSRSDEKKTDDPDVITPKDCKYRIIRVYVEYNDSSSQSILSEIRVHGTKTGENTAELRTGSLEEITGLKAFDDTEYAKSITKEETIENVYGIIDRTIGAEYRDWFTFEIAPNTQSDYDFYELSDVNGKIHIKGNEGLSLATGLNYYYKNYVNVQISEQTMQVNMPKNIVPIGSVVRKETPMKVRYAYNYCTLSYTFAFFGEEEWQRENDWLALNGVNVVLDLAGQEATWIKFLMNYGYSYDDAKDWLVGPAYYAWQFMDNMEVFGGPIPDGYVIDRVELARSTQRWKRSLGMQTVLQGYAGMVPTDFGDYNPDVQIIPQSNWNGFSRPSMIATDSQAYDDMAAKFYEAQEFVYGKTSNYYAVDPFHEGGKRPEGLTDDQISKEVLESMLRYDENAVWTVQAWQSNPTDALLDGMGDLRENHVLIVDLIKYALESNLNYKKTNYTNPSLDTTEFNNTSWAWCLLGNFGGNPTMNGQLETMVREIQSAKKECKHMVGLGIISEATFDNPMVYDLIFDLAWADENFDLDKWMDNYIERRYGGISENAKLAWDLIKGANYSQGVRLTSELFGVRTGGVPRNIGKKSVGYNSADLENALRLLLSDFEQFKDSAGYRYDLTEIMRQVVSNYTLLKYSEVIDARDAKDLETFRVKKEEFLHAFDILNEVAATQKEQLGGEWIGKAQDRAENYDDFSKSTFEMNAKSLITTWGSIGGSLVDYGFRTYEGMFIDVRKENWIQYLDQVEKNIEDGSSITTPSSASGYARIYWKNWVIPEQEYTRYVKDTPADLLAVSKKVLNDCVFTGELDPNLGNVALKRETTTSGIVISGTEKYVTDGNTDKVLSVLAKGDTKPEIIVDLLGVFDLSKIDIVLSQDCAYELYASSDRTNWDKISEKALGSFNETGDMFENLNKVGRYIKIVGTDTLSVKEIRVYGLRSLPTLDQLEALARTVENLDISTATDEQAKTLKESLKIALDAVANEEAPDTVNSVFWDLYDKTVVIDLYGEINVALKKPVTAHNDPSGNSKNLVDGTSSAWDSGRLSPPGLPYEDKITPGWAIIDLQGLKTISEIKLTFASNVWHQYELYISVDGENWTLVGEKKTQNKPNSNEDNHKLNNQYARYIKMATTNIELEGSKRAPYKVTELVALGRNVLVNKDNLGALIQSTKELLESNYTDSSWKALQTALENAIRVNNDEFALPEDIENVENELTEAMDKLVNISELQKVIENAENISGEKYTEDSWAVFVKALAAANALIIKEDATQAEVDVAIQILNDAVKALEEKPEVVETDKLALQIAIEMAENADLEKVVPAVVKEFNEALANAKDVFDNASATQDEVDNAFNRLANVMQMLEFFKGDKTALQKMADQIADLTASDYIESTWNAMLPALEKANDVLGNENAMQEEVDEAYTQLVKAFLNLRLKPNKDLLNDLINKANGLKEAKYTEASWKVMDEALNEAKAVLDNPEATKQEVVNAKEALTRALAGLVEKPAADNNVNTVKPRDTTVSVKTGDETSLGMLMSLAGLSVLGVVYSKKKRENI